MTFAELLRARRIDAGLSQQELADRMDPPVSRVAIHRWEAGEVLPSRQRVIAIVAALGLAPEAVAGFEQVAQADAAGRHLARSIHDETRAAG